MAGSFTGTRLGVVTARILAQQLEVPLLGLSSLGTMAWHYRDELIEQDGVVSRRAQQGHQYLGIYRYQGEVLTLFGAIACWPTTKQKRF